MVPAMSKMGYLSYSPLQSRRWCYSICIAVAELLLVGLNLKWYVQFMAWLGMWDC
jgi:hypothetical protein